MSHEVCSHSHSHSVLTFLSSPGGGYDAIIGRHKHNDNDGDKVRVSKEFIHPKYNEQTTNNDFMVLKLSRETKAGTPVKINSSRSTPQDNQNVVVMGFGVTNENTQQTSNKLMEVTVKVVSDSECRQKYGNEVIASTMICAASPSKDSCQGDSKCIASLQNKLFFFFYKRSHSHKQNFLKAADL